MGIRIFDNDPDARPKQRFSDDVVGRFRSGTLLNNRPMALDEWRVTSGDPEVARAVQAMLGGEDPEEWETQSEEKWEVFTEAKSLAIVLDGPASLKTGMALWGRNGLIHSCDGEVTTDGTPCPMAGKSVKERKEAAKAGFGCEPSIQVYFRLAEDPDLGKFKFFSGSWTMAAVIDQAEDALAALDGPALATLSLEVVEFDTKAGRHVRYTKPVLKVRGPA